VLVHNPLELIIPRTLFCQGWMSTDGRFPTVEGFAPTTPNLPFFHGEFENRFGDRCQAKNPTVLILLFIKFALVVMRLALKVGDALFR